MSDTTTRLSQGTQDGDKMDGSLITQAGDGVTQAKRQRVVIAGDAQGAAIVDPVAADPGKNPYSVPALSVGVVSDARPGGYIDGELRPISLTSDGRIRVVAGSPDCYIDLFGDTSPISTDPRGCQMTLASDNPWGI